MYLKKDTPGSEPVTSPALAVVLGIAVAATLVLGADRLLLRGRGRLGSDARRRRHLGGRALNSWRTSANTKDDE